MIYTIGDFIHRLNQQNIEAVNMQSDEALEAINECLPRNMMVRKQFIERTGKDESLSDIKQEEREQKPCQAQDSR